MINQDKLQEEIIIMKRSIAKLVREQDKKYIGKIEKFNDGLILAVADFKCQKCGTNKDLQIHHLIMRKAKDFMDFWRYASARYYWSNSIILCKNCHAEYHGFMGKDVGERKVISLKNMERWKKEYSYQDG